MNDSTENTNELDSYGVWVKNKPSEAEQNMEDLEKNTSDSLDFSDALDLPDFDTDFESSDFEDIFSDNNSQPQESDDDTTLNSDELLNIANGADLIQSEETSQDSLMEDDFNFATQDYSTDETISDDFETQNFEEVTNDSLSSDDFSIDSDFNIEEENKEPIITDEIADVSSDDFNFDAFSDEDNVVAENENDALNLDDFETETSSSEETEISLDDFMDEGFSDESVAAGNNGYEPGAPNSPSAMSASSSEEISLDDFIENGFENEKEEVVVDEKPLDMDISFDSSADSVKTEHNFSIDKDLFDDDDTEQSSVQNENYESSSDATISSDIEAEEVDLSDFGIDENAEETPVTQDIEASKVKEEVVDYDLVVENDNAVSAPFVNEIRSNQNDIAEEPTVQNTATAAVDMSVLQQIVADLSNLKNEINSLKANISEIKTKETTSEHISDEDLGIVEDKDEGGFFGNEDTDETISLSTDELSNIMTSASISEEESENNDATITTDDVEENSEQFTTEEVSGDETIEETPEVIEEEGVNFIEETSVSEQDIGIPDTIEEDLSMDFSDEKLEEPNLSNIEEEIVSEESSFDEEDLPQEIEIEKDDILVESSSTDFMSSISDDTEVQTDEEVTSSNEDTLVEEPLTEEAFEENNLTEETLEDEITDEIEEEIAIETPVVEEKTFTEESSYSENPLEDFSVIQEVEDSLENAVVVDDSALVEEALLQDDPIIEDATEEETETFANDTNETLVEDELSVGDDFSIEDTIVEESIEETSIDETVVEEDATIVDEGAELSENDQITFTDVFEEKTQEETPSFDLDDNFATVDDDFGIISENAVDITQDEDVFDTGNEKNDISESNLDYLTTTVESEVTSNDDNSELKNDIKSVLRYMDQLLENLPEEKIVEFAKSEEFTTYKKLFTELGLD